MQIKDFNLDSSFALADLDLLAIAKLIGGNLIGPNRLVEYLVRLKDKRTNSLKNFLSYSTTPEYFQYFLHSKCESTIVSKDLFNTYNSSEGKSMIVVDGQADTAFFELHQRLASSGAYPKLKSYIGHGCNIHPSAVIDDNVVIMDNVHIGAFCRIHENSFISNNVVIKSNAAIGGFGFERKTLFGKASIVTHTGGVYLGPNTTIGSFTAIDRGEMNEFTKVGENTNIDNLVHIAHNAVIGPNCMIIAGAEISGSTHLGEGVWYAPNACCNPELLIGDHSFIGTGAVVVKDVKNFALVYGNPARQFGWMCKCQRYKLFFSDSTAICSCGRNYEIHNEVVFLIKDI